MSPPHWINPLIKGLALKETFSTSALGWRYVDGLLN